MPSPFYAARLAEFQSQVRMWPVTITVNNEGATVIMTPERTEKRMTGHNYIDVVMSTMDALRTDCERLGIIQTKDKPRPRFQVVSSGVTFEIQAQDNDPNEPTTQSKCAKVQ